MNDRIRTAATAGMLLAMSGAGALAASAVATAPADVHANRTSSSTVIGTIRAAQPVDTANCRNSWCAAAGGYVRSNKLRFARAGQRGRAAATAGYDYNVPLALPPYGYSPSFWGYGGRRHYDKFGNYTKYGQ